MKKFAFLSCILALTVGIACGQQDKSKRPSPPAKATATLNNGATVTIDYSQPSVKGRTIGKEIAPYGKVWRTGANEATSFEVSKDVKIEGQALKAGKYGLYSIPGEKEWTIIFNKGWEQSGLDYKEGEDVLRVKVKPSKASQASEKMTFMVEKSGTVSLLWGGEKVDFKIQ
jgi:hypothetical protein